MVLPLTQGRGYWHAWLAAIFTSPLVYAILVGYMQSGRVSVPSGEVATIGDGAYLFSTHLTNSAYT